MINNIAHAISNTRLSTLYYILATIAFVCVLRSSLTIQVIDSRQTTSLNQIDLNRIESISEAPRETENQNEGKPEAIDERIYDPDDPRIRYVAFGSSSTWGAGYPDEYDRHTFAYPWLLSPKATNLAIRASGPNYPAYCISTMVERSFFDVIILEYFMLASEGLPILARRLRERYPDAIIIFLKNWYPRLVSTYYEGKLMTVHHWADAKGFEHNGALLNPDLHKMFKESDLEWFSPQWRNPKYDGVLEDAAREIGGIVSTMVEPEDIRDWTQYANLFAPDGHHLSFDGHAEVAERVREIVRQHGVNAHPRLGKFAYNDNCENWFESGVVKNIEFSESGSIEQMPNTPKYGLSFRGGEGWIKVHNPSDIPQTLFLGYMTTGPPPSKYPVTEMKVVDSEEPPLELNMDSSEVFGDKPVHISKLVDAGLIPPGSTTVTFRSLEETERPFRLVSVLITTKNEDDYALNDRLPGGSEN